MPSRPREEALSEVIGFILILALIAALASLYLTYVVPAQGREVEIRHMAGINDQFLDYKTGVDSLWINDQTNVPISRTFTLGTLTGLTQGAFVIPLFQPYPSSGTMVVNGRGESISFNLDLLITGYQGVHHYFDVNTSNITDNNGLIFSPSNDEDWYLFINSTRSLRATTTNFPTEDISPLDFDNKNWPNSRPILENWILGVSQWTESFRPHFCYDLTITAVKNGNKTIENLVVVNCISNNTLYRIDLFDYTYGIIGDTMQEITVINPPQSYWTYSIPSNSGFTTQNTSFSHELGSLEFLSSNNYWIQQNYYYQQGGVFLQQPDGMVTKVIPLISITNQSGIPSVKIVDLFINRIGPSNIGGTSPVQVISRLNSVTHNIVNGSTLAKGVPNARNVTITVTAQDVPAAQMWNRTFASIKSTAGGQSWIVNTQNGNLATLTIDPFPASPDYNIILDYSQVNLSVELQPIAI